MSEGQLDPTSYPSLVARIKAASLANGASRGNRCCGGLARTCEEELAALSCEP